MKDKTSFQTALVGVFVLFIVLGVMAFGGMLPGFSNEKKGKDGPAAINYGTVTVWGTLPQVAVDRALGVDKEEHPLKIIYTEKKGSGFRQQLLEALAGGSGPDLIILPHEEFGEYRSNLKPIPFNVYSERLFRESYVEAAEVYMDLEGVLALPMAIDPMVLYWNRDIFSANSIVTTPIVWEEMRVLAPKLVEKETVGEIEQSMIPLGTYRNVDHARDIISMLVVQAGARIVTINNGKLSLDVNGADGNNALADALAFYMEFSDPLKEVYTWNRSLPSSQDQFIAGRSAMYLGFAGELDIMQKTNPHLNFDVARVPQIREAEKKTTYGTVYGISMLNTTQNYDGALSAAFILASANYDKEISSIMKLPPVHRSLLQEYPDDPYQSLFYDAAISAKAWRNPSDIQTEDIFSEAIDGILSGRFVPVSAASYIQTRINKLIN